MDSLALPKLRVTVPVQGPLLQESTKSLSRELRILSLGSQKALLGGGSRVCVCFARGYCGNERQRNYAQSQEN